MIQPGSMVVSDNPLVAPQVVAVPKFGVPLRDLAPNALGPLMLRVNGGWLLREQWSRPAFPGDVIEWHVLPMGGGGNAGASRTVLTLVAMVAIAYFTMGTGIPALGILPNTFAASAAGMVASLAATALINALIPIQQPSVAGGATASPGAVYNVQTSGNQARLAQPIPVIYGRMQTFPDYAGQPYTEFSENDAYFMAVYCVSQGEVICERLQIDDTSISHFQDVEYEILPPGSLPTLASANVVTAPEVTGQTMETSKYIGGFAACGPTQVAGAIGIDVIFPGGLGLANGSTGAIGDLSASFKVEARAIDDFGTALGTWFALGNATVTASTNTPQRRSYKYALTTIGRVEVRIVRTDVRNETNLALHEMTWGGLRAYLGVPQGKGVDGPPKRIFYWFDTATGVSTVAYVQPDYASGLYGTSLIRGSTTQAPAGKMLTYIGEVNNWDSALPYVIDGGGDLKKASVPLLRLCTIEYDATFGKYLGILDAGGTEYLVNPDGSIHSSQATELPAAWSGQVAVKFLGRWRLFSGYGYYTRDETTAIPSQWTRSTAWLIMYGYNPSNTKGNWVDFPLGALTLQSENTLVVASLYYSKIRILRTTDGVNWGGEADPYTGYTTDRYVGTCDMRYVNGDDNPFYNALSSNSGNSPQRMIRVGACAAVYFTAGSTNKLGLYVFLSNSTGEVWTLHRCTLDGVDSGIDDAHTPVNLVGVSDGSAVVGQTFVFNPSKPLGPYDVSLVASTDGIAFITVDPLTIPTNVDGVKYAPAGQDALRPMSSDGTRVLFERGSMVSTSPAGMSPPPMSATATHMAIRMRASEQLSGLTSRKISGIWRRKLRTWSNSGGWSGLVETRNPMWARLDKLTDTAYGDGLADARIDLQTHADLAAIYEQRQDRFDALFDSKVTSIDADRTICMTGRAVPFQRAGVMTVARDQLQTLPVTAYTSRDITPGSMSINYALANETTADGVIVEYFDYRAWDWREILCRAPGVLVPTNAVRQRLMGITGPKQAEREGLYLAAQNVYRRKFPVFTTEMQGLLPAYGSAAIFSPALPGWGQAGDVAFWEPSTLVMGLTEPPVFTPGATHYISLVRSDGSVTPAIAVTPGPTEYDVILASTPDFELNLDDANRERPKFIFGVDGEHRIMVRILGIRKKGRSNDGAPAIEISTVAEDIRVHQVDLALLPGPGEIQDAVPDEGVPDTGGGGGGSLVLINLVGTTIYAGTIHDYVIDDNSYEDYYPGLTATFTMFNTGLASGQGHDDYQDYDYDFPSQWSLYGVLEPSDAAKYEVRATPKKFPTAFTGSAIGTWQSMDTTRSWVMGVMGDDSNKNVTETLKVEIREIATGVVAASANIKMYLGVWGAEFVPPESTGG